MKRVLLLVLAGLALAGAWAAWRGSTERAERAPAPAAPANEREAPAPIALAPAAQDRSAVAAEAPAPADDASAAAEGADEDLPPAPAHPGPGQALLRVEVVAVETGEPLPGAGLDLLPIDFDDETHQWLDSTQPDPSRGLDNDFVVADANGRCEFIVGADFGYTLRGRGENGLAAEREVPLAPFAAGEERALRLELETAWTLRWQGRVVDGEHGAPIPGVEVTAYAASGMREAKSRADLHSFGRAVSDGNGRVALTLPSFERSIWLAEAEGFFPTGGDVAASADELDTEPLLTLRRPAGLDVLVTDENGVPRADVDVQLGNVFAVVGEHLLLFQLQPRRTTGADGRCAFDGLPPMAPISFELSQPGRLPQTPREAARPELEPGRRASVTWVFESGATVMAVARTPGGAPIEGVQVGLRSMPYWSAEAEATYRGHVLTWSSFGSAASTRNPTDASGRVRFEGVPRGWCLVGAADARFPGVVRSVRVAEEIAGDEVELVLESCELEGRVVTPDGEPVRWSRVSWRGSSPGLDTVQGDTHADEDGFTTGPLVPGEYVFEAGPDDDPFQRGSEPVVVAGPSEPIEIRLRRAGQVRGTLVGADGAPVEGRVQAVGGWSEDTEGGAFELSQLAGGAHDLIAWADDGRMGVLQGVRVTEGSTTEGVVIPVADSAEVQVVTRGEERSALRTVLLWNGIELESTSAVPWQDASDFVTLPGEIEVRWLRRRPLGPDVLEHAERRTVAAGDSVTLEYDIP